jgi:hypothetical protein
MDHPHTPWVPHTAVTEFAVICPQPKVHVMPEVVHNVPAFGTICGHCELPCTRGESQIHWLLPTILTHTHSLPPAYSHSWLTLVQATVPTGNAEGHWPAGLGAAQVCFATIHLPLVQVA